MKKLIFFIILTFFLFWGISFIQDACFFVKGWLCPIGSYQEEVVLLDGEVYSVCCVYEYEY